jgi:hypothetical protein
VPPFSNLEEMTYFTKSCLEFMVFATLQLPSLWFPANGNIIKGKIIYYYYYYSTCITVCPHSKFGRNDIFVRNLAWNLWYWRCPSHLLSDFLQMEIVIRRKLLLLQLNYYDVKTNHRGQADLTLHFTIPHSFVIRTAVYAVMLLLRMAMINARNL